jgi:L-threonylcarbamoyladenylate synthase
MTTSKEIIQETVAHLRNGNTILYPTDTIWGIGCDATCVGAVRKVFTIKQRPDIKSMLLLASSVEMLREYVTAIPGKALHLIAEEQRPLTIIYPGARNLPAELIDEDGSIGFRITLDTFCRELITQFGKPLVSTSANFSGFPYPGSFDEIDPKIIDMVDYVVRWREQDASLTVPSKIIKIDPSGKLRVIRE